MKTILLAAALAISLPTLCLAEQPLSDDQAIKVIEAFWNASLFNIPLGEFDVVPDGSDGGPGSIPKAALQRWYLPLQQAGVIKITEDQGTAAKIAVTVTAEGQKKNVSKDPEMLAMPQGLQKIDKITGNEPVRKGVEDYRIVRVLYTVNWDDAVAQVQSFCDQPVTPKQRAIVLLKFDAPSSEWQVVAEDDANDADHFCTQNVTSALQ